MKASCTTMKQSRRLSWLLPLAFALPFALAAGLVMSLYGQTILDLLMVAVKMVVIA